MLCASSTATLSSNAFSHCSFTLLYSKIRFIYPSFKTVDLAISVPKNKIEPIEKSIVRIKHIAFRDFESVICPPMRLLLCRFS
ncbi:MAG: hypothetical protein ACLTC7_09250 [Eubacterium sp.]